MFAKVVIDARAGQRQNDAAEIVVISRAGGDQTGAQLFDAVGVVGQRCGGLRLLGQRVAGAIAGRQVGVAVCTAGVGSHRAGAGTDRGTNAGAIAGQAREGDLHTAHTGLTTSLDAVSIEIDINIAGQPLTGFAEVVACCAIIGRHGDGVDQGMCAGDAGRCRTYDTVDRAALGAGLRTGMGHAGRCGFGDGVGTWTQATEAVCAIGRTRGGGRADNRAQVVGTVQGQRHAGDARGVTGVAHGVAVGVNKDITGQGGRQEFAKVVFGFGLVGRQDDAGKAFGVAIASRAEYLATGGERDDIGDEIAVLFLAVEIAGRLHVLANGVTGRVTGR